MKEKLKKIIFVFILSIPFNICIAQTKIFSIYVDGNGTYAGTSHGVYYLPTKTFDWKLANSGLPDGVDIIEFITHKNILFGVDQSEGLYFSKDKSEIWEKVFYFPKDFKNVISLFENDSALFVMDKNKGTIYSKDEGLTWQTMNLSNWLNEISLSIYEKAEEKKRKNKDKNKVETNIGLEKSITNLVVCGKVFLAGVSTKSSGGFVFKSTDNGSTWLESSFELQNVNIKRIYSNGNKVYVLTAGLNSGLFCSENYGANWTKLSKPPIRSVTSFCANEKNLFVGNYYDGICTSADNGVTWVKIDSLLLKKNQTIDHLAITDEGLFVGTSDGIIFMTNENGKWKVKNSGLDTKKAGSFSYSTLGSQNGVELGTGKHTDVIIFEVRNSTAKTLNVYIKISIECEYTSDLGIVSLPKKEIEWLISVDANSTKSYDTNPEECAISACKNKTKNWEVVSWKVYE